MKNYMMRNANDSPEAMFQNVYDKIFSPIFYDENRSWMKTDVKEKDGNYILEIDLPGYTKENIDLNLNEGYLTVSAEMSTETDDSNEKEKYLHKERFYGKCSRSFYVGENITEEDINASFKNGILSITFPKEEEKIEQPKKHIEISD